jgi:transposase InsO family protein
VIDRTSKLSYSHCTTRPIVRPPYASSSALIAAVPYRLHTVLTDNGIQFADLPKIAGWTARYRVHRFDQICRANGIEHRLTKPNQPPWTNGQVERMNRTLKEATVNRYHYDTDEQLRAQICNAWTKETARFTLDPIQQMPGLKK